LLQKNNIEFS